MPEAFQHRLLSHVAQLGMYFLPNELAFLAATAPIEGTLRDKLAFRLHEDETVNTQYSVVRDYRALERPAAATLALLTPLGEPAILIDLRPAHNPAVLATSTYLLMQSLEFMTHTLPQTVQWYHVFVQHLPQLRADAPWSVFTPMTGTSNLPPPLQAWFDAWQQTQDQAQLQLIDQWKQLATNHLGFDPQRIEACVLQGGNYYLTTHRFIIYVCGPFGHAESLAQLTRWQSASKA
jgi:hypothetical protein